MLNVVKKKLLSISIGDIGLESSTLSLEHQLLMDLEMKRLERTSSEKEEKMKSLFFNEGASERE